MTIIIFSSLAQFLKVWGISGLSSKVYWTQAQHCSWLIVLLKKSRSHYKELQHWLMMQCHAATQSHCQCHHSIAPLPIAPWCQQLLDDVHVIVLFSNFLDMLQKSHHRALPFSHHWAVPFCTDVAITVAHDGATATQSFQLSHINFQMPTTTGLQTWSFWLFFVIFLTCHTNLPAIDSATLHWYPASTHDDATAPCGNQKLPTPSPPASRWWPFDCFIIF